MRKCINIYSLPRSGTNLFAGYLMRHPKIVSHNVGGGRHPFRANFNSLQHEIFTAAGAFKDYNKDTYYLRDELKFSFVGSKRTWSEQALFKIYVSLFKKFNKSIVLIRNPYAIASSMYDYQLKNSSHSDLWDVSSKRILDKFVKNFVFLVNNSKRVINEGGIIVDPYLFFTEKSMQSSLFDFLCLNASDMQKIERCKKGHKFKIVDNELACPCGKLEGFGGFNPLSQLESRRLLTNEKYIEAGFINALKIKLDMKLGKSIAQCFSETGVTDLDELLKQLIK